MSSRARTTRSPGRTSAAVKPKGARIPTPDRWLWIARSVVCVCIGLALGRAFLLQWATAHNALPTPAVSTSAPGRGQGTAPQAAALPAPTLPAPPSPAVLAAFSASTILRIVLTQPIYGLIWGIAVA